MDIERFLKTLEMGDLSVFDPLTREMQRRQDLHMMYTTLSSLHYEGHRVRVVQWLDFIEKANAFSAFKTSLLAHSKKWPLDLLRADTQDILSGDWRLIPAGSFVMGAPTTEVGYNGEAQHEVTITRPFLLKTTPVTQKEWRALMGEYPYYSKRNPKRPASPLSWYDAIAYCNQLSKKIGWPGAYDLTNIEGHHEDLNYICDVTWIGLTAADGYRLPTEAEWEYACRAGTTTSYYNGHSVSAHSKDPNLDLIAWYYDGQKPNPKRITYPVKQKAPNPWGLYDMLGNVWEWCWDEYGRYPSTPQVDPIGAAGSSGVIQRGGAVYNWASQTTASYREADARTSNSGFSGFRPARTCA
jgi:sulfatase modifying factor 1